MDTHSIDLPNGDPATGFGEAFPSTAISHADPHVQHEGPYALAAQLRLSAWVNMSSGLPLPDPPPFVPVSVGFASATPAAIVEALNRAVASKAVVILDFQERFVGVVYYG